MSFNCFNNVWNEIFKENNTSYLGGMIGIVGLMLVYVYSSHHNFLTDKSNNRIMCDSRPMAECSSLEKFWSYVYFGKVVESTERYTGLKVSPSVTDIKTLTFEGHIDNEHECVNWGPSFSFPVLVVRNEYERCWNEIQSRRNLRLISLIGTEGIGKSVFIYWLIYKLVKEARDSNRPIPSILLIKNGGHGKIYLLLTTVNGEPVVKHTNSLTCADYTLSDYVCDPEVNTKYWNLNVVDFGVNDYKFQEGVDDVGQEYGLTLMMSPCPLEEIQAMVGRDAIENAYFSYTVFGGSAKMTWCLLKTKAVFVDKLVLEIVFTELKQYLCGSQYADRYDLIMQASRIIAEHIETRNYYMNNWLSLTPKHSLFMHVYEETAADGIVDTRTCYASTFMSMLADKLRKEL